MSIELARQILADGKQWGKLYNHNLTTDQIVKILQAYEDALNERDTHHSEELAQQREGYNKEISKLNGTIGGLRRAANKESAQ